ncbi:hypothetical protein Y032_0220g2509 [Ancylostoma ceylanicum]|uniref:Uncharacterized protein n=1 Tax=Ancylostoma ceylanicum TaxID=53326 RepID=A0A016SJD0_9BILA|nr:hypothetical protein Y032_0220g2509 [Ancylostoma ceylanicum]
MIRYACPVYDRDTTGNRVLFILQQPTELQGWEKPGGRARGHRTQCQGSRIIWTVLREHSNNGESVNVNSYISAQQMLSSLPWPMYQ